MLPGHILNSIHLRLYCEIDQKIGFDTLDDKDKINSRFFLFPNGEVCARTVPQQHAQCFRLGRHLVVLGVVRVLLSVTYKTRLHPLHLY